jgi:hypothetical protein
VCRLIGSGRSDKRMIDVACFKEGPKLFYFAASISVWTACGNPSGNGTSALA